MSTPHNYLRIGALVALALSFPTLAFAAVFPTPLSTVRAVNLKATLQVDGVPVKSPAVVGANADFTIVWSSQGVGCVSNWSPDTLPASGSSVGSITENRQFVITCYGRGAAQSANLQVNVGVTDLSIPSLAITNLRKVKTAGTYVADAHTLKATLRNLGKLAAAVPFRVQFELSNDGSTNWVALGDYAVAGLAGSATAALEHEWHSTAGVAKVYLRACADKTEKVAESNETNNCSRILGPYAFAAKPL